MTNTTPVQLDLELDETSKSYAFIHRAGCRDLKDPLPLGPIYSLDDVGVIVAEETGWECEDAYEFVSPCARGAFRHDR